MKMPMPPCLGCPDRKAECHSKCIRYANYVIEAEIWRKYIQTQKEAEIYRRELSVEFDRTRRKR